MSAGYYVSKEQMTELLRVVGGIRCEVREAIPLVDLLRGIQRQGIDLDQDQAAVKPQE